MSTTDHFYERLPSFADFLEFSHTDRYQPLPDDWFIVITDVHNSASAIDEGRYKHVNAMGVASIVSLLNAVQPLKIPYVFGGDGATACVPLSVVNIVKPALSATKRLAADCFKLDLRIGIVPLADIRKVGYQVLIGKYQPHPSYQQAMFAGEGLGYAEKLVKDTRSDNQFLITDQKIANETIFKGFECRWNEIPSPYEETIALLVRVLGDNVSERNRVYQKVFSQITEIYGRENLCHPLREQNLSLTPTFELLSVEAGIRTAHQSKWRRFVYLLKLQILRIVGWWFMARGVKTEHADWGQYKRNLILNTDYRKFDETLRMVISGSKAQRGRLRKILGDYQRNGQVVFGIHAASSSLITCVVANYDKDHVHFLDSSDGGYAIAAQEMKQQLEEDARRIKQR